MTRPSVAKQRADQYELAGDHESAAYWFERYRRGAGARALAQQAEAQGDHLRAQRLLAEADLAEQTEDYCKRCRRRLNDVAANPDEWSMRVGNGDAIYCLGCIGDACRDQARLDWLGGRNIELLRFPQFTRVITGWEPTIYHSDAPVYHDAPTLREAVDLARSKES